MSDLQFREKTTKQWQVQKGIRNSDSICRPNKDEFIILLPSVSSIQNSERVARNIIDDMSKALALDGQQYYITASLGISHYPSDTENSKELIPLAKAAMKKSKSSGGNTFTR